MSKKHIGTLIVLDILMGLYSAYDFWFFDTFYYAIEKSIGRNFAFGCFLVSLFEICLSLLALLFDIIALCKDLFVVRITIKCIFYLLSIGFVIYLWFWSRISGTPIEFFILIAFLSGTMKGESKNYVENIQESNFRISQAQAQAQYQPPVLGTQEQSPILYPDNSSNVVQYQQKEQTPAEPQMEEQKESHIEPKMEEQKESHIEPQIEQQKESHIEPQIEEQKESHIEPQIEQQKESHIEPQIEEKKESHIEPQIKDLNEPQPELEIREQNQMP